jgi:acetyltransferase-like isoleucine patch superfamily enzyme
MNDLKEKLYELYKGQEKFLKEKFNRSLSFQDGLFDRFERAENLGFGEGASIYNSALIFGSVSVGSKTWIGPYVIIDGSGGGVRIGSYCSISAGVHIYTHDTVMWALSGGKKPYYQKNVCIGNNTHIGAQSIIKAGIEIGNYCVVGANTFVNKNIYNNSIVVGNPCKIIGKVNIDDDEIFLEYY